MIAFHCPECDAELEVADSHAGARFKCPDCGQRFLVPNRSRPGTRRQVDAGPRPRSAGRGKQRSERPSRDDFRSKKNSNSVAIIVAAAAGGTVLCVALIIGLIVVFRS
jgi:DNA-directed RNA polymerase subunit RPC12/RpoP